jgi:hypothetical protein
VRHAGAEFAEGGHLLLDDELVVSFVEAVQRFFQNLVLPFQLLRFFTQRLLAVAQRVLGTLALADVADDAGVVALVAYRPGRQGKFDWHLLAAAGAREQFDRGADHVAFAGGGEARHAVAVRVMETLGDDQFEALAERFLFRVAEDPRRCLVPADDIARVVGGDDGVDRRFGDRAELLLGLLAFADVADDAGVVALVVQ